MLKEVIKITKKTIIGFLCILILAVFLTGCGETQQQQPLAQQSAQPNVQQPAGQQQLPLKLSQQVYEAWIKKIYIDLFLINGQEYPLDEATMNQLIQYLDQVYAQGDYQTKVWVLNLPQMVDQLIAAIPTATPEEVLAYRQQVLSFYGYQYDPLAQQYAQGSAQYQQVPQSYQQTTGEGDTSDQMMNQYIQDQMVSQGMSNYYNTMRSAMNTFTGYGGSGMGYNYYSGYDY